MYYSEIRPEVVYGIFDETTYWNGNLYQTKHVVMSDINIIDYINELDNDIELHIMADGNLLLTAFMPCGVETVEKDFSAYYLEKEGKCALCLPKVLGEAVVTPSAYYDDRLTKFLAKDVVSVVCAIVECETKDIILFVKRVDVVQLDFLKKAFENNNKFTPDELAEWRKNVVVPEPIHSNIANATFTGNWGDVLSNFIFVSY